LRLQRPALTRGLFACLVGMRYCAAWPMPVNPNVTRCPGLFCPLLPLQPSLRWARLVFG
jgi:hypothetical protein